MVAKARVTFPASLSYPINSQASSNPICTMARTACLAVVLATAAERRYSSCLRAAFGSHAAGGLTTISAAATDFIPTTQDVNVTQPRIPVNCSNPFLRASLRQQCSL